ncbi:MAG: Gfo/Idh/MocA family oxidoreductase [Planctomycetes bacterium]|nr:Gfo/Idh/MocA family oxidoreductase [Planctomycetota bacterium]
MKTPRAVVIGYGFAGRCFHTYLIKLTPGLQLHGVASRSPETRARVQKDLGCKTYASFDAVLDDRDVDLVVLATPHDTHCDLAVRALDAGKHVVTDKVMCLNLSECDRMIGAAKKAGRMLNVFHNRRFDGDYLTVRKLLDDGKLGRVHWLEMAWQGFGPPGGWRGTAEAGGGRFFDLGAHLVDQTVQLFPQVIESVYARIHRHFEKAGVESHATIVIGFAGGCTGIVDAGSMAAVRKPRYYVLGDQAGFIKYGVDPQEAAMIKGDIDAAREDEKNYGRLGDGKTEEIVPTLQGRWRNYYENIAAVLTQGAEPAVSLASVRRALAVLDAAQKSAQTGTALRLDYPALNSLR